MASVAALAGAVLDNVRKTSLRQRASRSWRRRVSVAVLVFWSAWLLALLGTIGRQYAQTPPGLAPELERWLERLGSTGLGGPVAVRLGNSGDCACDEQAWEGLASAVRREHGQALTMDAPLPAPGVEVAILGPEGHLRYAGALTPDPSACGMDGPQLLARWLPGLLPERAPLYLPAGASCAC
jgi:hypothetical protein